MRVLSLQKKLVIHLSKDLLSLSPCARGCCRLRERLLLKECGVDRNATLALKQHRICSFLVEKHILEASR